MTTCAHCGRSIERDALDGWIDPLATDDDSVWRETCDAHDTFRAEHEPSIDVAALARTIQAFEFEHVFTLHEDGTITEPAGIYAPNVYDDPAGDVAIEDDRWRCMTGLTGQDHYRGAVMHASEYIGRGVAQAMLEMCQDEPTTFAVVVVEVLADDGLDGTWGHEPAGWAIAYLARQS